MPRTTEPISEVEVTLDGKRVRRFEVRAEAPRQHGKPRRRLKQRFTTRRGAIAWLAAVRAGTAPELQPEPLRTDFRHFAEAWLDVKKRTVRQITGYTYGGAVRIWAEHFDGKTLEEITKADVESLVTRYQDEGKGVARVSYLLMVLRQILAEAEDEELVSRNVASRVKARGRPGKARQAMSGGEVRQLRTWITEDRLEALWLLTLAGLRRSEVLGVRWADIDFDTGKLSISRARVGIGGSSEVNVTEPKTRKGTRTLTLPTALLDALRRFRAVQAEELGIVQARDGFIAVDEIGEPLRPEWYSDEWRRLCARAGIPVVTLHAARHTSVTLMRDLGIPDHLVAEWHGHDEVIMRRTYSHASESGLKDAGDRLFEATGGA